MSHLRPRSDLQITEVGDDLVLFDPADHRVITLNTTARAVWTLCDGTRDEPKIVEALAESFEGGRSRIEADVAHLISQFKEAGLLDPSLETK